MLSMLLSLVWFLLIGLGAGWLAGQLTLGDDFGILGNLIVGVIGAILGGLVIKLLGFTAWGVIAELITATGGAILFLYLLRWFRQHRK